MPIHYDLHACWLVAVAAALAACSGSNGTMSPTNTIGPYDCSGTALPATAATVVSVSGTVTEITLGGPAGVPGATLEAFRTGDTSPLATTTTAADGSYTISVTTGGVPLDGYLRVDKASYDTTYLYPSAPLVASFAGAKIVLLNPFELSVLANAAGITLSSTNGLVVLTVVDCTGKVLAGATVSSNPAAGATRYNSGGEPQSSASATDVDGLAYLLNLPAGNVAVQGSSGSHTLRSHTLNARAGAITQTILAPGPTTPPE